MRRAYRVDDARLHVEAGGVTFSNPIGLAAGYDKNGRAIRVMESLGFGHVEIGSISADFSAGNPKPRLWRLPEDRGICVHYGLPNDGAEAVARRLAGLKRTLPLGINLVKTNRGIDAAAEPEEAVVEDYVRSTRLLQHEADYLSLNLSCPNTEVGRDHFCEVIQVERLLRAVGQVPICRPVFLKVSPRGGVAAIERLLEAAEGFDWVKGFCFNLPPGLPAGLAATEARTRGMRGAVAGRPASALIDASISELYRRMDRKRHRIIGVGGVFSAADAYDKIRRGATLVQLFTGLVYEGPGLVRRINEGLLALLDRDGFKNVEEAVGSEINTGKVTWACTADATTLASGEET
jgi:dihydroorotate dehydrogenase (fumarate)/dihydroorotate dehydrogenase